MEDNALDGSGVFGGGEDGDAVVSERLRLREYVTGIVIGSLRLRVLSGEQEPG